MAASNVSGSAATNIVDRQLVLTRVFDAPRELVFKAWTETERLKRWWGPKGFTNPVCELDARPGGAIRIHMRGPDGMIYAMTGVIRELAEPERLVFASVALDENGDPLFEILNTVTFSSLGSKTEIKLCAQVIKATAAAPQYLRGMEMGWSQSLDRLAAELAGSRSNTGVFGITRAFVAPRDLVWKAFTEPEHLVQWWGPKGFSMQVARLDLRPGGVFHYSMRSPEGRTMWGKFVYREIAAPERITFVNSFCDEQGDLVRNPFNPNWPLEVLNTITFSEQDGKTTLILSGGPINASEEEAQTYEGGRDSMQKGFTGTFDQLAAYLAILAGVHPL